MLKPALKERLVWTVPKGVQTARTVRSSKYFIFESKVTSYAPNISNICFSILGAKCDAVTGQCKCGPGYTGWYCESVCPPNHYGIGCKGKGKCKNGECDPKTGE